MTLFDIINTLIGVPVLILGILVMWAFRRYVFIISGSITQHFGAFIFWASTKAVCRSLWWDVFSGFNLGNGSNWVVNLIGLYAIYHALKALHLLIPTEDRDKYNLITSVFYPSKFWMKK